MPRLSAGSLHRIRFTLNGRAVSGKRRTSHAAERFYPSCDRRDRNTCRLRARRLRRLHRANRQYAGTLLHYACRAGRRRQIRTVEGLAPAAAACRRCRMLSVRNYGLQCGFCTPGILMSLDALLRDRPDATEPEIREFLSGHLCRCTGYGSIVKAALALRANCQMARGKPTCLTSARAFWRASSAIREALAIVDGTCGSPIGAWYAKISARRRRASTRSDSSPATIWSPSCRTAGRPRRIHWACQFAGIIITPLNWRAKGRRDRFLPSRMPSARGDRLPGRFRRSGVRRKACPSPAAHRASRVPAFGGTRSFTLGRQPKPPMQRRAPMRDAWSLMLYTSGTTSRPKGVPRRHRAERAAAVAHVAQNLYRHGERTLGVMPLYHTMGVRSLLAMSLIGGTFVCLPRFDVGRALRSDRRRASHAISIWCRRSTTTSCIIRISPRPTSARCASSALPARR